MIGVDQCPVCKSSRVMGTHISKFNPLRDPKGERGTNNYMICGDCDPVTMWEVIDRNNLSDPESALSIFNSPCDNCAFRPGSPERNDKDKWELLQQEIHLKGIPFYCHKGVPIDFDDETQSHVHPKRPDGNYDTEKMRLCAGYLAQRLGHLSMVADKLAETEVEG